MGMSSPAGREAAASALENETALTSFQPIDPEPEAAKLLFYF